MWLLRLRRHVVGGPLSNPAVTLRCRLPFIQVPNPPSSSLRYPEMNPGARDKHLASSGATNPFAEVLALRYARCPRLFPTSSRPSPRDSRFLSYPAPVPILVLGRRFPAFSSPTMHSCIRILPRSSILRTPVPRYLPTANAPSYPCACLKPRRPRVPDIVPASIIHSCLRSPEASRVPHALQLKHAAVPLLRLAALFGFTSSFLFSASCFRPYVLKPQVLRPLVVSTLHCPGIPSILLRLCTPI